MRRRRCVDCGIYEALPEDELCEECLERNTTDTVIYKIPWQKYDPENPPEFEKTFLVTNGRRVFPALLALEKRCGLQWWQEEEDYLITNVTHYAPINLPESEE